MKNLILIATVLFTNISHSKIIEIYNTKTQSIVTMEKLLSELSHNGYFILGEFHNTEEIQLAQAELINKKVHFNQDQNNFSVFWEFLDHTNQETINSEFSKLLSGTITTTDFITSTAGKQNLSYAPIIKVLKTSNGVLRGINLPRALKQKVMKEGIQSIDPIFIPKNHYVGGENYKERFTAAMGGHVPAEAIAKYFLAQCLTDSVMANQISQYTNNQLNFVVAGSFHTDYFDATVVRLSKLVNNNIYTFKFISSNQSSIEDIELYKSQDEKYGYFADYIVISR